MPDYYNKAFQGGPKIGNKPRTEFEPNKIPGIFDPLGIGNSIMGGMSKAPVIGNMMNKMGSFASKIPGIGGLFGSEDKPSNRELLMYHYSKVGNLQARAEAETDPKKLAKLQKNLNANKGKVEKYAYKMDKKTRPGGAFLPPRTFDEIDSSRKAYIEKMQAGPEVSKRTITRTL